ncbi:hypothetical protein ACFL1W_01125 [Candidatus Margulisiibacteriota bacterium]
MSFIPPLPLQTESINIAKTSGQHQGLSIEIDYGDYKGHPEVVNLDIRVRKMVQGIQNFLGKRKVLCKIKIILQEKIMASKPNSGDDVEIAAHNHAVSDNEHVVKISMRLVIRGKQNIFKGIKHELTHAIVRSVSRRKIYEGMTEWFKEGLAVYAANQIDDRLNAWFNEATFDVGMPFPKMSATQREDLIYQVFNGLENTLFRDRGIVPGHSFLDYLEDGLVFRYIETVYGPQGLRSFIMHVVNGASERAALSLLSGLTFEEFSRDFYEYARETVNSLYPPAN